MVSAFGEDGPRTQLPPHTGQLQGVGKQAAQSMCSGRESDSDIPSDQAAPGLDRQGRGSGDRTEPVKVDRRDNRRRDGGRNRIPEPDGSLLPCSPYREKMRMSAR